MHLRTLIILLAMLGSDALQAQSSYTRGANLSVDVAADGRIVIDLLGDLWLVPGSGGDAVQLTEGIRSAQRPRWSPDGRHIVYQANVAGQRGLWLYDMQSGERRSLSAAGRIDTQPEWHPGGEKIVYSSDTDGGGFNLWEQDLPTGLTWKLSTQPGDESDPAWSADGRDLVYVHHDGSVWSLVLRRHGQAEEILLTTTDKLLVPSWRPDGSLITVFRSSAGKVSLDMVILSAPRLVRRYDDREPFVPTSMNWLDRQQLVFAAAGQIRKRKFDAWRSRPVAFRATEQVRVATLDDRERPSFEWLNEPQGKLVIHAKRLFDGITPGYQYDRDIQISGGRISAVKAHDEHGSAISIDMGDLTILPGFIDCDARLPAGLTASHGPDLLTMGITSIVASHPDSEQLHALWSGKEVPGPRFLAAEKWPLGAMSPAEVDVTAAVSCSRNSNRVTGAALPMQFRSLQVAGLDAEQVLRAVGVNAAALLLADPYLGRIAPGSAADLVFVDGDPLAEPGDALNVVAVVRNGRFFSVSGLIDRAKRAETVD